MSQNLTYHVNESKKNDQRMREVLKDLPDFT